MLKVKGVTRLTLRHGSHCRDAFSVESLCNPTNRLECITKMQAHPMPTAKANEPFKDAAVLIPIVVPKHGNEISLLYTLRSANLKKHSGQVSFPGQCLLSNRKLTVLNHFRFDATTGGIRDTVDVSFTECALRETEEEIGIKGDQIDVWGETRKFYPGNGTSIMPVVGCIHNYDPSDLRINTQEVARVFTIPLRTLCKHKRHTQFRAQYSIPVFVCPGAVQRVWGITAIISDFLLRSLLPADIYENRVKFLSKYK